MPVIAIRAYIECDACGQSFSVAIDESSTVPTGWCMWDVAQDAVRGGVDYREPSGTPLLAFSAVEQEKMLCFQCAVEDLAAEPPEEIR